MSKKEVISEREIELLNNPFLTNYLSYNRWQESPDDFHFWVGATLIGASTQRKVRINRPYLKLYPNLFTAIVAESAICRKTTAMEIGMNLYYKSLGFEPDKSNVITGKVTPAALVEFMCPAKSDYAKGTVFIQSDELDIFFSQEAINYGLATLMTSLYTCKDIHHHLTKTMGKYIVKNSFINILAATVPSDLQEKVGSIMDKGLVGRFSFVHKEKPKARIPRPEMVIDFEEYELLQKVLAKQLKGISKLKGDFHITSEAGKIFDDWYVNIPNENRRDKGSVASGFIGRKGDHALKLSMILALSKDPFGLKPLEIDESCIKGGIECSEEGDRSIESIFESTSGAEIFKLQEKVEYFLHGRGRASRTLLIQNFYRLITSDQMSVILCTLSQARIIWEHKEGRRTDVYYIDENLRNLSDEEIFPEIEKSFNLKLKDGRLRRST